MSCEGRRILPSLLSESPTLIVCVPDNSSRDLEMNTEFSQTHGDLLPSRVHKHNSLEYPCR